MKQKLLGFAAGVLATMLVLAIATPSFASNVAQTISAVFNSIGITLNDTPVASAGESYTLTDGTEVPYSILYKGTTYLPLRKVGELLGLGVEYNAVTKSAKLSTLETTTPAAPDTSEFKSSDLQEIDKAINWNDSENASFLKFKEIWDVNISYDTEYNIMVYDLTFKSDQNTQSDKLFLKELGQEKLDLYILKWMRDIYLENNEEKQVKFDIYAVYSWIQIDTMQLYRAQFPLTIREMQ